MGANVEIKARLHEPTRQRQLAAALADGPAAVIEQRDTFFAARRGRLKLRQLSPDRGELIHYDRADASGPTLSRYAIVPTTEPEPLRRLLADALEVRGEVRKNRTLYLVGQTRVHLDEVAQLGHFLELEVVLREGQPVEEGEQIAQELMRALDVRDQDLVEDAYIDLLLA
jgi:predicted adenylyl cyclase CyaB